MTGGVAVALLRIRGRSGTPNNGVAFRPCERTEETAWYGELLERGEYYGTSPATHPEFCRNNLQDAADDQDMAANVAQGQTQAAKVNASIATLNRDLCAATTAATGG